MIDQQRVQITDLKEQLNSLTSSDGDNSTVALQRQIQKLNKSIKMKDEFCSILSSELKKAQDELRGVKEKRPGNDVEDSGMQEVGNVEDVFLWLPGNVFSIDDNDLIVVKYLLCIWLLSGKYITHYFIACELPLLLLHYDVFCDNVMLIVYRLLQRLKIGRGSVSYYNNSLKNNVMHIAPRSNI